MDPAENQIMKAIYRQLTQNMGSCLLGVLFSMHMNKEESPLVRCPKTYDFDCFIFFKNLINQAMLNVNPSGIKSLEIANQFLIRWWRLIRIAANDIDKCSDFCIQMGSF